MPVQILEGAEILEVLHTSSELNTFVRSFYDCQYGDFFKVLSELFSLCCVDVVH